MKQLLLFSPLLLWSRQKQSCGLSSIMLLVVCQKTVKQNLSLTCFWRTYQGDKHLLHLMSWPIRFPQPNRKDTVSNFLKSINVYTFTQIARHVSSDKLCSSWTYTIARALTLFNSQRSCLRALYLLSRMALLIDEVPIQLQGHNIAAPSWLGEKLASFFRPFFSPPLYPEGWYMTALENTSHQHTRKVLTLKVHHH